MIEIGIDVGGTFTDVVLLDREKGVLHVTKTASTPEDQSKGILHGMVRLGVDPATIARFTHGSTVATNTVLERKGARVAMLTNQGFKDLLEIGRTNRTKVYDMKLVKPPALVQRRLRYEIGQRDYIGKLDNVPLSLAEIDAAIAECRREGVEAIAVCYLHSYRDSSDEEATVQRIRELAPEIPATGSADVVREYKEYERFSTATLNAYILPVMDRYLRGLAGRLSEGGYDGPIEVMRSAGGLMRADTARRYPVETLLSGPAAGVMGALHVAAASGFRNVITYDMGGTSTDVALIVNGRLTYTTDTRIADLPLKINQLDISTVGAGGGSIAAHSKEGALSVGPHSAGAVPGPACYNKGGQYPTVTDANTALRRLSASYALGGEIEVKPELSDAVIDRIAGELGLGREQMAEGILKLVNTKMASAIREISIQRGHDPRDFALVAYGGAGPMHAVELARDLAIPHVIIPPAPGNLCAFGLLVTDLVAEQSETILAKTADFEAAKLKAAFDRLAKAAAATLAADGVTEGIVYRYSADMRYIGQKSDIPVSITAEGMDPAAIEAKFFRSYSERFNHKERKAPTEIVTLRAFATSQINKPDLKKITAPESMGSPDKDGMLGRREVYFAGFGWLNCPVYERYSIPAGVTLAGPAIIEELGSTSVIGPSDKFTVDVANSIVVEIGKGIAVAEKE